MSFEKKSQETGQTHAEAHDRFAGDHWVLESRLETAADVGGAIETLLRNAGWTEDEIGVFDVSVSEAVANAIIHGNWGIEKKNYPSEAEYQRAIEEKGKNGGSEKVMVDIDLTDHDVTVTVRDEAARVFDATEIPDPTTPEGLGKTSGRGKKIIDACDEVDFSVPGVVKMRKLKRTGDEIG